MNRTKYQAARLRLDYYHEQKIARLQEAIERENVDYDMKCGALRDAADDYGDDENEWETDARGARMCGHGWSEDEGCGAGCFG